MNLQYNVVCRKIAFCRDKKTSLHSIHQCVPAGRRIQELALLQTEAELIGTWETGYSEP